MANRTVTAILTANVGQYVAAMQTAATATGAPSAAAVQGARLTQSAMTAAGAAMVGFGAVAGVALFAAVSAFADFEEAMSGVEAATRASGSTLDALGAAALEAGERTVFSAVEAAGAIEALAKAGISTSDILGGALAGSLDLAAAGGLGVAEAAEIAATAMVQFNLEGSEVTHVADLLAAGAGKAQGEVVDLAAALKQSGLVASQFDLTLEETTGTLAAFASAGLLGSDAGTSLRTMLLRLANPSKEAKAKMDELGISAYDAQGNFAGMESLAGQLKSQLTALPPVQRDAALAIIFGSDAIRGANVLYANGAEGIRNWTARVDDAGYASETAAIKLDNLKGDVSALGSALNSALTKIGEAGGGPLRFLVGLMTAIVAAFSGMPPVAQQVAFGLLAVATAVGLLGGAFLLLQPRLAAAMVQITLLRAAFPATTAAIAAMAGPIGIAVAAFSALAVASQYAGDSQATLQRRLAALKESAGPSVTDQIKALREEIERLDEIADKEHQGSFLGIDLYSEFTNVSRNAGNQAKVLKGELESLEAAEKAQREEIEKGIGPLGEVGAGLLAAGDAAGLSAEEMEAAAEAMKELAATIASFVDPLGAYTSLLDTATKAEQERATAVAEASESSADSWEDYVVAVSVSIDQYLAELQRQVDAQTNWQSNMLILSSKVSADTIAALTAMGVEGAPLVQALVDGSAEQFARLETLLPQSTSVGTAAMAATLKSAAPVLGALAGVAGDEVVARLSAELAAGTITVEEIMRVYGIKIENGVPKVINTDVSVSGVDEALRKIQLMRLALVDVDGRVATTYLRSITVRTVDNQMAGRLAEGGVVEFYARGGEHHVAQIAAAGTMRIWAEPETGGEAYIPLAAGKRDRSLAILQEVASRFGHVVVREDRFANAKPYASGGVNANPAAAGGGVTNNFVLDSAAAAATAKGYAREVLTQTRRDAALHGRAVAVT